MLGVVITRLMKTLKNPIETNMAFPAAITVLVDLIVYGLGSSFCSAPLPPRRAPLEPTLMPYCPMIVHFNHRQK